MKLPTCTVFVVASTLCAAQTASAQSVPPQYPWYIEGSAGGLWRMDASRTITFGPSEYVRGVAPPFLGLSPTNTITFDPGYVLNLGIGYKLPLGFRVEVEGGYSHYSAASLGPFTLQTNVFQPPTVIRLGLQSGGGRDQYSATFNAFYDLPLSGWIVPYLGAGAGINYLNAQTGYFGGSGGVPQFTQVGGSLTNVAVLAEIGVAITLNAQWAIVPSYRFEKVFTDSSNFPNNANIFKLGVRSSF